MSRLEVIDETKPLLPPQLQRVQRTNARIRTVSLSEEPILDEAIDNSPALTGDSGWKPIGFVLALISGVLFTGNNFLVQYLEVNAAEMLIVRSITQSLVLGLIVASLDHRDISADEQSKHSICVIRLFVFFQAVFGAARLYMNFLCLSYMPLGDALTIIFTEPLFTIVLSLIFFRIGIGFFKIVLGLGLIGGMILCIQPPFIFPNNEEVKEGDKEELEEGRGSAYYTGVALAAGCAFSGAVCNILIRECHGRVRTLSLVLHAGLAGIVVGLMGCAWDPDNSRLLLNIRTLSALDWLILIGISAVGMLAYVTMTAALKSITATTVSVLRALEIVLAYGCQIAFMGVVPNVMCIGGAALVMFCVIGIAVEESIKQRRMQRNQL